MSHTHLYLCDEVIYVDYLILIMFYTSLVDEQIVTISILIILELALIAV